jgi:ribosomal subunit interface protein
MQVQVHYQGVDPSPWMDQFVASRLKKLERYLGQSSSVQIHLKFDDRKYSTSMAIHGLFKDYAFTSDGENLYESFSLAIEKANRSLGEQKRKVKDKINKKYYSLKKDLVY